MPPPMNQSSIDMLQQGFAAGDQAQGYWQQNKRALSSNEQLYAEHLQRVLNGDEDPRAVARELHAKRRGLAVGGGLGGQAAPPVVGAGLGGASPAPQAPAAPPPAVQNLGPSPQQGAPLPPVTPTEQDPQTRTIDVPSDFQAQERAIAPQAPAPQAQAYAPQPPAPAAQGGLGSAPLMSSPASPNAPASLGGAYQPRMPAPENMQELNTLMRISPQIEQGRLRQAQARKAAEPSFDRMALERYRQSELDARARAGNDTKQTVAQTQVGGRAATNENTVAGNEGIASRAEAGKGERLATTEEGKNTRQTAKLDAAKTVKELGLNEDYKKHLDKMELGYAQLKGANERWANHEQGLLERADAHATTAEDRAFVKLQQDRLKAAEDARAKISGSPLLMADPGVKASARQLDEEIAKIKPGLDAWTAKTSDRISKAPVSQGGVSRMTCGPSSSASGGSGMGQQGAVPPGKIRVKQNSSGQTGTIDEKDFNPAKYTRL